MKKVHTLKTRIVSTLNALSWVALLVGAVGRMFCPGIAAWIFLAAAVSLVVTQFLLRVRGGNFVLKRLVFQQLIGGIVLVAAGVLMFTHTRNEWIAVMFVGTLFQLYAAFRIQKELEKQNLYN